MLFVQSALALVASAAVASALTHEPSLFEGSHGLEKRACPKVNLSVAQKKEAAALSSLSKALASKSKSIAAKSKSVAAKASAVSKSASKAAKASSAAAKAEKSISAAAASVSAKAASVSAKASSVSAKASSVNAKQSSINSKSSSVASHASAVASSASSVSSAAAAASSSAAANANSNCYKLSSLDITITSTAADVASCEESCGANYAVVALLEVNSPPATCYCVNADSLDDLEAADADKCDAVYGSTSGSYVSAFSSA